jgi:hypothetical protein
MINLACNATIRKRSLSAKTYAMLRCSDVP